MSGNEGDIEMGNPTPDPTAPGEVGSLPPEPVVKGALKPVAEYTPFEIAAAGLGFVAFVTALASMIVNLGGTAVPAGILAVALGGYSFHQQTQLTDIRTLKETAKRVKEEVQRLEEENQRLKSSVEDLGQTVDELQDVEKCLDAITQTQGQSVDALKKQLEENRQILGKMEENMRGQIIQNLLTIVYRGDDDGDEIISDEEATEVIESMQALSGLQFNADKLRAKLVGKHVAEICKMVTDLVNDDLPPEEKIFEIEMEDIKLND